MDTIIIPKLNPVEFKRADTDVWEVDRQPYFEQRTKYCQKFQTSDFIRFQFLIENELFISADAYYFVYPARPEDRTITIDTEALSYDSLYTSYNCYFELSDISDNVYIYIYLRIVLSTGTVIYYSEPIHIKTTHENTILLEYGHDVNDFNLIFQPEPGTSYSFQMRVEGGLPSKGYDPRSRDVIYVNDRVDMTTVHSTPYLVKRFTFGSSTGIPPWMADKINRAFSCYYVLIDNIYYSKIENAKYEATRLENYPFAGWELDLIENEEMNTFPPLPAPDQRIYYLYRGVITDDEFDPGTINEDVCYVPRYDQSAGHTYTNFGGLETARGELAIFRYDTEAEGWFKDTWGIYVPIETGEYTYSLREGVKEEIDPSLAGLTYPVFMFQIFETSGGNLYPQPGIQMYWDFADEKWYIEAKETVDVLIRFFGVEVLV